MFRSKCESVIGNMKNDAEIHGPKSYSARYVEDYIAIAGSPIRGLVLMKLFQFQRSSQLTLGERSVTAPTYKRIAHLLKVHVKTVQRSVNELEDMGIIETGLIYFGGSPRRFVHVKLADPDQVEIGHYQLLQNGGNYPED